MEYPGSKSKGDVFLSCMKEKRYSRELVLEEHALVHVLSGELKIVFGDRSQTFKPGATILLARNQLGRIAKIPASDNEPFKSISILLRQEVLKKYYELHKVEPVHHKESLIKEIDPHPLLESLFNSLLPYFTFSEELPIDIAAVKTEEAITVLRSIDKNVDGILGRFEAPGKIDLVDYMMNNFMFNLPLEKFGYLTGRSLTTFKKDFIKAFNTVPGKWLTQKRLELAHYQIFENRRKPSEVYFEVGFENLSHFSYAFKNKFGYSPTKRSQEIR